MNLDSECPFWTQQLLCEEKSKCFVFRVEESDIPISWKSSETDLINLESSNLKTEKTNSSKEEWFLDDYNQAVYVNLKTNPAGWTGYQGKKIWSIIYEENFFNDHEKTFSDEKIFNNVISGLHASISSHLSEFYFEEGKNKSKPNFRLFFEKVGNHPERISNLYFIYSLLLR